MRRSQETDGCQRNRFFFRKHVAPEAVEPVVSKADAAQGDVNQGTDCGNNEMCL